MPITALCITIAAITAAAGLGSSAKGTSDQHKAQVLTANSKERLNFASTNLDTLRGQCNTALESLGREKISVLNGSVRTFVDLFSQIKAVDLTSSQGLDELGHLHIDEATFSDLKSMTAVAASLAGGIAAGAAGGALAALGAYGAAGAFATASTGTAIASLSGAAATNATLAFFGGGSLAAGGLGMAGGTAVLGGLVAGPALMIMGTVIAAAGGKNLEKAKINAAEIDVTCEQLEAGAAQCTAIRRRTNMFYNLLARLDAYVAPLLLAMKDVIDNEGTYYPDYSEQSKQVIISTVSLIQSIKAILDTPILTESGEVSDQSELTGQKVGQIADSHMA